MNRMGISMTSVYAVMAGEYDDHHVESIWSTESAADARFDELKKLQREYGSTYPLSLQRWPLDTTDPNYLTEPGRSWPECNEILRSYDGKTDERGDWRNDRWGHENVT
jgi:hypothetical protein